MKNIYFLHKKHISVTPFLVFTYIIACVLVFAVMMRGGNAVAIGILSILTLITAVLVKYDKSIGVYIDDKQICYRGVKKKYYNIGDIKGIKIIKSYSAGGKYRGFYELKDKNGDFLYTTFFLKQVNDEIKAYEKGDLWFAQEFKKQILCSSVYDKDAIKYIQEENPNIIVVC